MAKITTNTMESKNLTETVCADGTACVRLTANLDGNPVGGCNINIIPTDQTTYQQSKEEIRSAINNFVQDVLDQAQAQECIAEEFAEATDTISTETDAVMSTISNKSRSKKS